MTVASVTDLDGKQALEIKMDEVMNVGDIVLLNGEPLSLVSRAGVNGRRAYAFEVQVAEIGSCILCAQIRVELEFDQSAADVEGWLEATMEENRAFLRYHVILTLDGSGLPVGGQPEGQTPYEVLRNKLQWQRKCPYVRLGYTK